MTIRAVHLLALLALLLFSGLSQAACTLPSASAAFGTVTSFTLNTTVSPTSSTVNVNCGTGLSTTLLSSDTITMSLASATYTSATRGALKVSAASTDAVPVRLCTDSACANELTIGGTAYTYTRAALLSLVTTGQNFALPIYLRTVAGQTVAAGSYAVTLNMLVTYNVCTVNLAGICIGNQSGSATVPVSLTLTVTNDCTTITAPNINFGSAPLVSSFSSIAQSISVICTKGSTYTVGLSNGSHAVNSQRYMTSGTNQLAYEIYKGTSSNRWGPTGTDRVASTSANSVSTDGLTRTYNYTATILSSQSTPVAGSYSDSVVVDLSF